VLTFPSASKKVGLAAGFPLALARRMASDPGVDVHALLELVDRGCPPKLAAKIMAPLDGDPKPT
jgi:hypothetical protein